MYSDRRQIRAGHGDACGIGEAIVRGLARIFEETPVRAARNPPTPSVPLAYPQAGERETKTAGLKTSYFNS